ncbi:MAG TPA: putative lipid II flippase FtsW, partial [Treponema sp.]|nr:putative lipid II flippase FtsW [Treponema sp.]
MYRSNTGAAHTGFREDHVLAACVLLLTGLGFVTLYSASFGYAQLFWKDGYHFISRQIGLGLVGIAAFFFLSWFSLDKMRKFILPLVIIALVLCALAFLPGIGVTRNGASRWIRIPFTQSTYQPSEMAKLALPLFIADIFDRRQDRLDDLKAGVRPVAIVCLLFCGLIYLQNNFSTVVFIAVNALVIFYLAGIRLKFFVLALVFILPLLGLLLFTAEHRVVRFASFFRPGIDPQGAGYQVRNSLLTITSGGFFGKGIGQGTRKIASVPEVHSDFIFAAFVEESGFLGVLLLAALFTVFAVLGYRSAMRADTVFKRLLAASLVTMIVSQVLVNVAVVSGALPATGIPLPFFSAGGSSLATTLMCAG